MRKETRSGRSNSLTKMNILTLLFVVTVTLAKTFQIEFYTSDCPEASHKFGRIEASARVRYRHSDPLKVKSIRWVSPDPQYRMEFFKNSKAKLPYATIIPTSIGQTPKDADVCLWKGKGDTFAVHLDGIAEGDGILLEKGSYLYVSMVGYDYV